MSLIHQPLINQHYIPYLSQNQKLISSCTQRLLQLQTQLQSKTLKQQLVSSLTMKEFSLRKLIEQQDLLIVYLKDQLTELEARKAQGISMQKAMIEMEEKYLALGELKSMDQGEGEKYLAKLKGEYNQLQDTLTQMSKESSTLYQLKIKLNQRNSFTEGLLKEKTVDYLNVKGDHDREFVINEKTRSDCLVLRDQNEKNKSLNIKYTRQLTDKRTQVQDNKLKLISLQKQVQRYEQQRARLRQIQKAAQKDNHLLKQTLKNKVQTMKQKEEQLQRLKRQKQLLQKRKNQETTALDNIITQKNEWKQTLFQEQSNRQSLKQKFQLFTKDKFTAQTQIQRLQNQTHYLQTLKHQTLTSCLSIQQTIQKNIYFIDQYILINSQLLSEIQVLLSEEISKSALTSINVRNNYQLKRANQVFQLRQFLSLMSEKMNHAQKSVELLVTGFNNYKLC